MKSVQRFDYARFGEALVERGLIDRDILNHVFQQCNTTRALLTELLVRDNLVSDWEVARVSCELYHLPFLPVDQYPPASTALEGFDAAYLRHYALVPLDRYGALVTVVMPGLVPSEVLEGLRPGQGGRVLAVVGSVVSNRRWLQEHFGTPAHAPGHAQGQGQGHAHPPQAGKAGHAPPIPLATPKAAIPKTPPLPADSPIKLVGEEDWGDLFDAGEQAVQLDLKKPRER